MTDLRTTLEKIVATHGTGTHVGHDRCVLDAIERAIATDEAGLDVETLAEALHRQHDDYRCGGAPWHVAEAKAIAAEYGRLRVKP